MWFTMPIIKMWPIFVIITIYLLSTYYVLGILHILRPHKPPVIVPALGLFASDPCSALESRG